MEPNNKTNSKPENNFKPEERSIKEKRIREITLIYYSRQDVRKVLFEFSKNRECIPRYFEGFGKRPDNFQYDSDILEHVKRGATSFHSSEELWKDPLEISTELSKKEFDELRIGWDLLLDIDSPYLEYSKIYAELLIDTLKFHGIKNIGVKFSGSKGFHIIIPWKAFPKEIYSQKTKDMFPEWPRIICQYLAESIQKKLEEKILNDQNLKELAKRTGKEEKDLVVRECISCKRPVATKFLITWICPFCKNEIVTIEGMYNNKRKSRCPECRKDLEEKSKKEIYVCEYCNINSQKNPEFFEKKERFATEKLIDADLVLVAPRHLFRMPYSLHEKTALASIVIDKDKIKDFQITDAKPFKITPKDFYPSSKEGEAKELLLQALEWYEQKQKIEKSIEEKKYSANNQNKSFENSEKSKEPYKKIKIENPAENIFPPCIKLILSGLKQDGRKRVLFILINFFKSLGIDDLPLEKRIYEWNEKNELPLKKGYIQSQLSWYKRNVQMMPQNCSNPIYKDLGLCKPNEFCRQIKNPVNYSVKAYFKSIR
jgi:hypothetical protein